MKVWTSEHVFEHPWDTVVQAAWRKYPNPINPVVTGLDVLDRTVDNNGVMRSSRLLQTEWWIPGWATRLIGLENPSYSQEYSEVDPVKKTMTLKSRNLTCSNYVVVDETLIYRPHPEKPGHTLLEQSAVISVRNVPLISRMESLMASMINTNASKGRLGMEWVINCIKAEFDELSLKLSTEYDDLASSARRSYDDLKRSTPGIILEEVQKARLGAGLVSGR